MTQPAHEKVLIVDFGSQVTQLIARRVRESGVYCEIHPFDKIDDVLGGFSPKAVILSGGPASVHENESPAVTKKVFELGVPVLGICYGEQTMCAELGGKVFVINGDVGVTGEVCCRIIGAHFLQIIIAPVPLLKLIDLHGG